MYTLYVCVCTFIYLNCVCFYLHVFTRECRSPRPKLCIVDQRNATFAVPYAEVATRIVKGFLSTISVISFPGVYKGLMVLFRLSLSPLLSLFLQDRVQRCRALTFPSLVHRAGHGRAGGRRAAHRLPAAASARSPGGSGKLHGTQDYMCSDVARDRLTALPYNMRVAGDVLGLYCRIHSDSSG